jgi:hypothetical protein
VDYSRFHQKNIDSAKPEKSTLGIYAQYPSTAEKSAKADSSPTPAQLLKKRKYKRLRKAAQLLPTEKIANCQKCIAPGYAYAVGRTNGHFRGLEACDSPSCPHCVAARSERDRHELTIALAEAAKLGWKPFMVTLTLRHMRQDLLVALLDMLTEAFDKCFSGRWYQDLKDEYQLKTKVKTWETMTGSNGWHPHLHILIWSGLQLNDYAFAGLEKTIGLRWLETLKKLGGSALLEYGISIETADSKIADYIAKWGHEPSESSWGIESEMTKAHSKHSRLEGLTPFEVLGAAAGEADQLERLARIYPALSSDELKTFAGKLYVEYFKAFKGKPRLHWGNTKKLLNLDEALAAWDEANPPAPDEHYDMVMIERGAEWLKVHGGYKGDDLRAELLDVCSTGNPYLVRQWLADREIVGIIPDNAWDQFNQVGGRVWFSPPGDEWIPAAGGRVLM